MRLNPTFAKPLAELNKPELALDLAHLELSCRIPVVQLIPSAYYTNHTAQGVKMAGKVKAIKIDTREARAKLEARGQPYYSEVLAGLSLGYRKGARRGVWVTRRWLGEGYVVTNIGIADDAEQADDQRILSFDQAKRRAFALASEPAKQAKTTKGRLAPRGAKTAPYTVADALADYLTFLDAKRKSGPKSRALANGSIIPKLGHIPLRDLDKATLDGWLHDLAASSRRVRGGREQPPPATDEERRKRRASANRTWAVLSGALNHALAENRIGIDEGWRRVRPLKEAEATDQRYLSAEEARELVAGAPDDFRALLCAALHSGARYSELARLIVADFNPRADSVLVRYSKTGKSRQIILTEEGSAFFAGLCAGRAPHEIMLRQASGREWVPGAADRPMRRACAKAGIVRAHFHSLRHTFASHSAMDGLSSMLIAKSLGHSTTKQVEKCYAHLSPAGMREAIRKLRKPLGLDG
jgi:integrase